MDFIICGFLTLILSWTFPTTWGPRITYIMPFALGALISRFSIIRPKIPSSFKKDFLLVLFFSFFSFLFGFYWIPHTLTEFNQIGFPWNWLIGSLFVFIAWPQYYVALILFYSLEKYRPNIMAKFRAIPMPLKQVLLAFLMVLLEEYVPQEFPAHWGHPFIIYAPYLKLVPYFGSPLISFMVFLVAFMFSDFLINRKYNIFNILLVIILITLNIFLPQNLPPAFNSHQLRIVQGNIGDLRKLESERARETGGEAYQNVFTTYKRLSTKDITKPIDLIIWPETSVPSIFDSSNLIPHQAIFDVIRATNAEIIFGGYDQPLQSKGEFRTLYNSIIHLDNQAKLKNIYHKVHLLPFGEDIPLGPLTPYLWRLFPSISFFATGDSFEMFYTNKGIPFTSVICYEILLSSFMRSHMQKLPQYPHFIINLTNDSWYGDTSEPLHHLELSLWRALEFQIPLIRATNTGITTIVNSDGTMMKDKIPTNMEAVKDFTLKTPVETKPTIYFKYGLIPLFLLVLSYCSLLFLILRRGKKIYKNL